MKKAIPHERSRVSALLAALGLLSLLVVFGIAADDRDLLRKSAGQPYVFIIMDTSGSMNWTPPCDHKDAASDANPYDGACTITCPMDNATCARLCPSACVSWDAAKPDLNAPELQPIVIDDSDTARFTATIGSTTYSGSNLSLAASGYKTNIAAYGPSFDNFYQYGPTRPGTSTNDPSTDASHVANTSSKAIFKWTTELPKAGLYHVYAYWYIRRDPSDPDPDTNPNGSTQARLTVEYFDSASNLTRKRYLEMNQRRGDRFAFIGTFDFDKNALNKVPAVVSIANFDETGSTAVVKDEIHADAIAFVPVPEVPAGAACQKMAPSCLQPLCPEGDCYAPASGDDPTSKFFQAKQAMYEVLSEITDVNFGFGSYEQDSPHIMYKHWMYEATTAPFFNFPDGASGTIPFPEVGRRDVFGTGPPWDLAGRNTSDVNFFHCNSDSLAPYPEDDHVIGCMSAYPADVTDLWEMERMRMAPKLGKGGDIDTSMYFRAWNGSQYNVYRIAWRAKYNIDSNTSSKNIDLGDDTITVGIDIWRCDNLGSDSDCNSTFYSNHLITDKLVEYRLVGDFVPFNIGIGRAPMTGMGYFSSVGLTNSGSYPAGLSTQSGVQADGGRSCLGLEPNHDWNVNVAGYASPITTVAEDDAWGTSGSDYAFKRPWVKDARGDKTPGGVTQAHQNWFDTGDFLPWDWNVDKDNNKLIRSFLAPNITRDDTAQSTPDFRLATFFHDRVLNPKSGLSINDNGSNELRKIRLRDDVRLFSNNGTPDDVDDDTYELDVDFPTDSNLPPGQKRRPLFASGSTPIYKSVLSFKDWYTGWKPYARQYDIDWQCRPKYLLFLTDGDETCDSVASGEQKVCEQVRLLAQTGAAEDRVKTYVVGFGLPGGGDALTCMAVKGLTEAPLLPRNKTELVNALTDIFNSIRTESFAFASASIPAVQSTAADKIYLSSFTPIQSRSVWPGRLDAFRQPLPLTKDGKPDVTFSCEEGGRESGCHLWDAADRLLAQAPTQSEVTEPGAPNFKLGMSFETQRRVLYGQANPTGVRKALRLMLPPTGYSDAAANLDRLDLAEVLLPSADYLAYKSVVTSGLTTVAQKQAAETLAEQQLNGVVGPALAIKVEEIPATTLTSFSCTGGKVVLGSTASRVECKYLMGDIFHANPTVIIGPNNFSYFKSDICGLGDYLDPADPNYATKVANARPSNCGLTAPPPSGVAINRGYREYVARNVWRRRMLIAATDDGQLHFFDAGVYTQVQVNSKAFDVFTDGKGYEIFSYAPRITMPAIRHQAIETKHIYSLDGSVAVGDAYIDPVNQPAKPAEREWRTILVGGMRESGDVFAQNANLSDLVPGYFALDVTQPDQYEAATPPRKPAAVDLGVPTCLTLDPTSKKQIAASGCKTLAGKPTQFPLELWTFQDQVRNGSAVYFLDEDQNGERDLGATWSEPVIGQIMVCKNPGGACNTNKDMTTRWVAIFGGGMDAVNKNNPKSGTWLYMVDLETGSAIYKRKLIGSAPSDPAVIDVDQDGILDVIYMGTTAGYLYKVDLRKTGGGGAVPGVIETYSMAKAKILGSPVDITVPRITDAAWEPFKLLYTGTTVAAGDGLPIYYPPAMFKIPELNQYGGLLLVGDRENLWSTVPSTYRPRIFVFVDEDYTSDVTLLASQMSELDIDSTVAATADYLISPPTGKKRGWTMELKAEFNNQTPPVETGPGKRNWRATGEPFLVAGVAVFSLFEPDNLPSVDPDGTKVCRRQGSTLGISLFVKNGNPLGNFGGVVQKDCVDADDLCCGGRCFKIDEFTTAIHTTSTVTKNRPPAERKDGGSYFGQKELVVNEAQKAMLDAIRNAIMDTMPSSCQYNEKYEISFAVLRNSTGLNELARVPMMVCPGDWKD